ncbi:unnamed protein product [Didymodactylos carnosus]|uniref:Stealth protein CR2 conserved region 2 domain-containing protein n=1 Tax=Didymodactylos carnosus TaxID=1234261 RepID=A0A814BQX9_9BILA|nr:unnamed protein product [Didymodactylos carnosus]CAF0930197.1 unnamed protein product [Didymodactylos carnosus]CAF3548485.1 unnamed protein product [Didymodactylos carnosus]CAF3708256.1 unnamed protein product [Didymodactylos carnosus]
MDEIYLPTFNSHAIEANLHKIPHLREFYLYFNDDYIFGRPVSINDFFNSTCLVIYGDDRLTSNTNVSLNIHKRAMLNTNAILDNQGFTNRTRHFLPHAPHPLRKSVAEELWSKTFSEIHRQQSSHRFRDMRDIHPTYFLSQYLLEQGYCVEQRRMKSTCVYGEDFCNQVLTNNLGKVRQFFDRLRMLSLMPKFLSINDRTSSNYTKQHIIHREFEGFLKDLFPKISRFESNDCTL